MDITGTTLHTNEFPHLCPKCPKELTSNSSLNSHLEAHLPREKREMECHHCKRKFLSKSQLRIHVSGHNGVKNFECKICGKKFPHPTSLKRHVNRHKSINAFACSLCPKTCNGKGNLKRHEKRVHGSGKVFSGKGNQHDPQRERFQCDKCPKSYLLKLLFDEHQLTHQDIEYSFKCDKCEKRFLTYRRLKEHTNRIHLDKASKLSCVFCEKQLPNFFLLQRHIISHTLERPYLCKLCPKECYDQISVRRHYKITHSKIREHFKCEICSKSFLSKLGLHNHIRQHIGELHYECQSLGCGMRFSSDGHRRRHFLKAHAGKQVFCTLCTKKFFTKSDLKQHVLIHSDFRGYQCQLCDASFKQRNNLVTHERIVHANRSKRN